LSRSGGQVETLEDIAKDVWRDVGLFAIRFSGDLAKTAMILVALVFFGWLIHLSRLLGLADKYADALELLHFCAYYAAFLIVCLDFVFKLAVSVFRKDHS
jgi:hypothetical protein